MQKYLLIILLLAGCAQKEIYIPPPTNSTYNNSDLKLRPYEVNGRWYYPKEVEVGEVFRGISSWYGPNFHGKLTANGEIYNMYAYTAASKTLPMNTKIKVTNLNNSKSVIVRINDRGPFVDDRILDLSYIAGKKIGLDKSGIAPVEIVVLSTPSKNFKKPKKIIKTYQKNGKIKIQIGAFKNISGAKIFKREFSKYKKSVYIKKIDGKYKVFIGDFSTKEEAIEFKDLNNIKGFIVD
jgi:rare lipoprotein A